MEVTGAKAIYNSGSKVDVGTAGKTSKVGGIEFAGALTADLDVSGAGGLDSGSKAADTWYGVFLIDGDGQNPALLLSGSFDSPTLPSGYTEKVLVWAIKTDGAKDIMRFLATGNGAKKRCWWDVGTDNLRIVYNEGQTSWTEADASPFAPPMTDLLHLQTKFETGVNGAASDDLRVRAKGMLNSAISPAPGVVSKAKTVGSVACPCDAAQKVEWKVDQAGNKLNEATIVVRGWDLDI